MSAPTEPGSDEELQHLFRTAAEGFEPDRQRLTLGGAALGRRLHRRRTAAVLGSAATVAALAVAGTLVLAPAGRTAATVAPAVASAKPGMTAKEMAAAVVAHLPGLQITRDTAGNLPIAGRQTREVVFTVDDGRGKESLMVAVNRFAPPVSASRKFGCPLSNQPAPTDECTLTTLPDGSSLRLGSSALPGGDPKRRWEAMLLTPAGLYVNVAEMNTASEEDQTVTRADAILPLAELQEIATDPVWQRAFAALPTEPTRPETVPAVPHDRVAAIAAPLIPAGFKATALVGGTPGEATFAVDGDGRYGELHIRVQDQAAADDFDTATTLPDGSRILVVQAEPKGPGQYALFNIVDVLRPDGRRIQLRAGNAVSGPASAAPMMPVLTVDQLRAIATSPAWKADPTG